MRSGRTIPLANSPLLWGSPDGASGACSQDGEIHKSEELKGEEALQALCFWLSQRPRLKKGSFPGLQVVRYSGSRDGSATESALHTLQVLSDNDC